MPHDAKGRKLTVGDRVLIPAVVKQIWEGEEYCNGQFAAEHPMYPGEDHTLITLNTRQVESTMPQEEA